MKTLLFNELGQKKRLEAGKEMVKAIRNQGFLQYGVFQVNDNLRIICQRKEEAIELIDDFLYFTYQKNFDLFKKDNSLVLLAIDSANIIYTYDGLCAEISKNGAIDFLLDRDMIEVI